MDFYKKGLEMLLAVDCIIFGFNGKKIEVLLIKRGMEPEKNKWSLMGGFVQPKESPEEAANRILKKLTGLKNVYMEHCSVFGHPTREKTQRVVSLSYFALIDTQQYQPILSDQYEAKWFPLEDYPKLIFDHDQMISAAKQNLRKKAKQSPILFKLLPEKFTIRQVVALYEAVYDMKLDKRNFNRKLLASGLIIKLQEKDKENSKRGAFFYTRDPDYDRTDNQRFF